jgi:hypothetical protein
MDWVVIGLGIGISTLAWRLRGTPSPLKGGRDSLTLSSDVTLSPQPLLTERELFLYNLMRLAVQEQYLVLTKVPLCSVILVEGKGSARSDLLRHIALKRLDFVLVHPGSRVVEQVVQLEDSQSFHAQKEDRRQIIKSVVESAGVRFTSLAPHTSYTIPQLAALLGVGDPESS